MHKRHYEWQGQSLEFSLQPVEKGWRLTLPDGRLVEVCEARVEGTLLLFRTESACWQVPFLVTPEEIHLLWQGHLYRFRRPRAVAAVGHTASEGTLVAPMPGLITRVLVQEGQAVEAGTRLIVLEAMKTEQSLRAPFDGIVRTLNAREGQIVQEGTLLVEIVPSSSE